jgi:hypothetical protein
LVMVCFFCFCFFFFFVSFSGVGLFLLKVCGAGAGEPGQDVPVLAQQWCMYVQELCSRAMY